MSKKPVSAPSLEMTKLDYEQYVNKKSPNSPLARNMLFAFLFGGLICAVGQAFIEIFTSLGMNKDSVATATAIVMVFLGAALTGMNFYDKMAKIAGAGTIIPITGFANSIVSIAMEYKSEGYILGVAAKMFVIAGPVLVFGTVSSVVAGVILWVLQMVGFM